MEKQSIDFGGCFEVTKVSHLNCIDLSSSDVDQSVTLLKQVLYPCLFFAFFFFLLSNEAADSLGSFFSALGFFSAAGDFSVGFFSALGAILQGREIQKNFVMRELVTKKRLELKYRDPRLARCLWRCGWFCIYRDN